MAVVAADVFAADVVAADVVAADVVAADVAAAVVAVVVVDEGSAVVSSGGSTVKLMDPDVDVC